ncbi:MAG: EF-hand domain-containing protein [Proteobacteria bacterium]|nr:EF-hand domain-containing protein [Pseudomonadota bacterium]
MKKIFIVMLTLLISVAFVSAVFAQAKPEAAPAKAPAKAEKASPAPEKAVAEKPAAEKAAPEKAAEPEKPKPKPKPKGVFIGNVSAVDAAMKTVTVVSKWGTKGEQGSVTFALNNASFKGYKSAGDIQVGDKAAVKYTKDGIEVKKIAGKKPEKAKKEAAKPKKGFKDVDANKDGKITIEELVIIFVNITPEQFKQFDKNNDGALDENEYKDAIKAMK